MNPSTGVCPARRRRTTRGWRGTHLRDTHAPTRSPARLCRRRRAATAARLSPSPGERVAAPNPTHHAAAPFDRPNGDPGAKQLECWIVLMHTPARSSYACALAARTARTTPTPNNWKPPPLARWRPRCCCFCFLHCQVGIAAQVYDLIDKHILQLDQDLKALDAEIKVDQDALGLTEDAAAVVGAAAGAAGAGATGAGDGAPTKVGPRGAGGARGVGRGPPCRPRLRSLPVRWGQRGGTVCAQSKQGWESGGQDAPYVARVPSGVACTSWCLRSPHRSYHEHSPSGTMLFACPCPSEVMVGCFVENGLRGMCVCVVGRVCTCRGTRAARQGATRAGGASGSPQPRYRRRRLHRSQNVSQLLPHRARDAAMEWKGQVWADALDCPHCVLHCAGRERRRESRHALP